MTPPDSHLRRQLQQRHHKRAAISLGMAVIAAVFILETFIADRHHPNPASPVLWAVLGAVVAGGIAGFVWFRHLAARAAR